VQARTLVIILVPMFALLLYLTRAWRREPALQHLVFALHYMAIVMVGLVAIGALGQGMARIPALRFLLATEARFGLVVMATLGAYLYVALRNAYGDRPLPAASRAVLLAFATVLLIIVYRLILFFTVFYTV
jgi:hypothetical protein